MGRPKGSKNKPKFDDVLPKEKKKSGRPKKIEPPVVKYAKAPTKQEVIDAGGIFADQSYCTACRLKIKLCKCKF